MYSIKMTYDENRRPFKIRSYKDAEKFITDVFRGDGIVTVIPNEFIITLHSNRDRYYITEKMGDIYDVFNPELRFDGVDAIRELYTYRRVINWFLEEMYS